MNEIIKRESKAEKWRGLITAQAESGQSIRAFCEAQEIREHCFGYWKKRFRDDATVLRTASSRFIAVGRVARDVRMRGPRIHLPNGVEIALGESLATEGVQQLIQGMCGVNRAKS